MVLPCSTGAEVAGVLGSAEAVAIGLAACSSDARTTAVLVRLTLALRREEVLA